MNNKCLHNEKISMALFFVTLAMYSFVYMTKNCYNAAMVYLVDDGILTKSQTGAISALFYLTYAPFQIMGGMAADKYSPFKLILIGLIGSALCNFAILFTESYPVMLAIWCFNGVIQFGIWPGVFKIMSSVLAPVHRRDAIFYALFGGTIGPVLSFCVAGFANTWKTNFVVATVILFTLSLVWFLLSPYFVKNLSDEDEHAHGVAHMPEPKKNENAKSSGAFSLFLKSGLVIMLLPMMIQSIFSVGIQAVVPTMIKESYYNVSPSVASFLAVFPVIIAVFGKLGMQAVYRKKIHNESMTLFITMMMVVAPLIVMSFIGRINYWIIIAMLSLCVAISNACGVVTATYLPIRFSKYGRTSTVSGIINAMASLGIVCSNYISPRLADMFGGWVEVVFAWCIFATAAALLYLASYIPWKKFVRE